MQIFVINYLRKSFNILNQSNPKKKSSALFFLLPEDVRFYPRPANSNNLFKASLPRTGVYFGVRFC